ncbi:endonuclease [Rossellomorea vietnamensis]|uniref:Endonuclease n=1 Tax=Rossellomorea vietnamensis TaxID=218284 RepID=A0A6I6UW89_9BACI|nr:endonuclease [Rossellomorea vietnamensis]QHE63196.1 endonuclease [Rossellomorea vietnamensis]
MLPCEESLSMICGKLLGDGCIVKQEGRKPRFQFIHSIKDKEWCYYCYSRLKDYLPLTGPHYKRIEDNRVQAGYTESYHVQSRTHDHITNLRSIWYKNRKKVLPFEFLGKYLTPLALAWWYQDDGHLKKVSTIPRKIILSTDNFTPAENNQLCQLLKNKYSLFFSIDKQNRIILYDQFQIHYFLFLVSPYLHPCMYRKTITSCDIYNQCLNPNRTTIYLPAHIKLTSPTREINEKLSMLPDIFTAIKCNNFYTNELLTFIESTKTHVSKKPYQIVVSEENLQNLSKLNKMTGLNASIVAQLCFMEVQSKKRLGQN